MVKLSGLGVAKVSEYRAYILGADGHIVSFRTFICGDDADATIWAKQMADTHGVELWSHDRFVTRLNSTGSAQAISHEIVLGRMVPKNRTH
jgi:hypothetical protein